MPENGIAFQALPVGAYTDALSIAEWADAHTNRKDSTKLLPLDLYDRIARWDQRCNAVMEFGRGTFIAAARADPALRRRLAPSALANLPLIGGYLADALGALFLRWMHNKYEDLSSGITLEQACTVIDDCKRRIQTGSSYLLGPFTYADIAAAVMLQNFGKSARPTAEPAEHAVANPRNLSDCIDEHLLNWSENIYEQHFPPSCPPQAKKT